MRFYRSVLVWCAAAAPLVASCAATTRVVGGSGGEPAATSSDAASSSSHAVSTSSHAVSSSSASGSIATTTASSSSSGAPTFSTPPGAGPMRAADGTSNVTFAITKLYLGDTDPDGTPDQINGWTHYGYNIDGVPSSDLGSFCKPQDNASPKQVHVEGPGGVENAWGHNILPILLGLASDYSAKVNQQIASGDFTVLFTLDALGTGSSYNPVLASVANGGNLGSTPKFDGTDVWPVVDGTTVSFSSSYVVGDTWVSAPLGSITITTGLSGASFGFPIQHAVFTMALDPTHTTAMHGVISGVISTQALQAQIQLVAGTFDASLCSGTTIQSILSQIAQASDILLDGTQDPTKTCDVISIGLGFDAALVQAGPSVAPASPPPNPCATDGGAGGGGAGGGGAGGGP